jgi:hypothetical protein
MNIILYMQDWTKIRILNTPFFFSLIYEILVTNLFDKKTIVIFKTNNTISYHTTSRHMFFHMMKRFDHLPTYATSYLKNFKILFIS